MSKTNQAGKGASHNEKMIEVRVRFWTDGIAKKKGNIIPKNAWDSGVVYVQRNASHGIKPRNPKPFNSLMTLNGVIEKVVIEHSIRLHSNRRSDKYFVP